METLHSSSPTIRYAYDVFLCFRGKDTRKGFTDHLYTALVGAGFHTFRDDEEIEKGSEIESELKRAIEKSRISIIVLSKNFASSRRCLDELVEILSCHKTFGQHLLPVFYDALPWQVRWQDGSFAEAFATHEARSNQETDEREREYLMDRIDTWRAALKGVAVLSGMVLQNEADGSKLKRWAI